MREKEKKKRTRNSNRELHVIMYLFVTLFLCMMGYFVYYVAVPGPVDINNSYNTRQENLAQKVVRGKILANDKEVLAQTEVSSDGTETRSYPFGKLFSHAVGFSTRGKTGIESQGNINLLTSNAYVVERIQNNIEEQKNIGDNVITTLDVKLQQVAYEALGVYKGAIIVMEPDTGKVLTMVSKPDFDPNTINDLWEEISSDTEESPLLNRATQGLYPPGSTFKIVTLLEYIRENTNYTDYHYDCNGKFTNNGITVNCYHNASHGSEDIYKSFAKSCNSSFANIGLTLDENSFKKTCEQLLFNKDLPIKIPFNRSEFSLKSGAGTEEIMHTAIGQGQTQITPMHMAMITCAIANQGVLKKPYVIDRIENYNGDVIKNYSSSSYGNLMTQEESAILTDFMEEVVQNGTGTKLKGQSYTVAGKTGSAEFGAQKGESHAWFTGFSNVENPDIVVTVIVEGAGSGGDYAVPMAKRIFDAYYN
ncbi:MAG: penicillin-binding transpeptidase domain-containing protein [Lachnospiraceae bacterium]|nr:penicillin-binding transpeptidase domain-containing protein [Lachnospiraceae bacterium]